MVNSNFIRNTALCGSLFVTGLSLQGCSGESEAARESSLSGDVPAATFTTEDLDRGIVTTGGVEVHVLGLDEDMTGNLSLDSLTESFDRVRLAQDLIGRTAVRFEDDLNPVDVGYSVEHSQGTHTFVVAPSRAVIATLVGTDRGVSALTVKEISDNEAENSITTYVASAPGEVDRFTGELPVDRYNVYVETCNLLTELVPDAETVDFLVEELEARSGESVNLANLEAVLTQYGLEAFCNSMSLMFAYSDLDKSYEEYVNFVSSQKLGENAASVFVIPYIVFSESVYERVAQPKD